jgi:hypothetical protein
MEVLKEERVAGLHRTFKEACSEVDRSSIIDTEGGEAREGAIIVLDETAGDVSPKAIARAEAYATAR